MFLSECGLLVLPYHQIDQSGVLTLAINYEIPILCSNLKGFRESLGEAGRYFEKGSVESLAEQLEIMFTEPGRLKQISENVRDQKAQWPDWSDIAAKTRYLYDSIL